MGGGILEEENIGATHSTRAHFSSTSFFMHWRCIRRKRNCPTLPLYSAVSSSLPDPAAPQKKLFPPFEHPLSCQRGVFKALVIVLKLERQDFLYDGCQQYLMQFLEAGCTPRSIKLCSRRHSCTHLYIMGGNKVREEASCWLKTL